MSEEVAAADAALTALHEAQQEVEMLKCEKDVLLIELEQARAIGRTLLSRCEAAEASAAVLREAINSARFDIHYRHKDSWTWEECPKPTCYPLREALDNDAGKAMLAELEAARAVVSIARRGFGTNADMLRAWAFDPVALSRAIVVYDEAVK